MSKNILIAVSCSCIFFSTLSALAFDLQVAWIERNPKDYNPMEQLGSNDRPQPGETNWWEVHVYNNSLQTSTPYTVTWHINTMQTGSQDMPALPPRAYGLAANRWIVPDDYTYDFSKPLTNVLTAIITAEGDARTNNNVLSVFMDALTYQVALYTGTFARYTIPDSTSIYEHLNYMFARLNHKLSQAVYPMAPQGILDRCRIDNVTLTDNRNISAEIPHPEYAVKAFLSDAYEGSRPGGVINYPHYFIGWFWYLNQLFSDNAMNAFVHECGHCLQAPDIYNFDLQGANNFVNPGVRVLSDWMDAPGKTDIMRSPYQGENSVFSEYDAVVINKQPGQPRPVTPEMLAGGPGNTNFGYMYSDLPQKVAFRLFNTDGTELDGILVKVYRGFLFFNDYYPNLGFTNTPYYAASYKNNVTFDPCFARHETFASKMSNCFQVGIYGGDHSYHHVFDFPRFNYMYWKGYTNTAVFCITNSYSVSQITDVKVEPGSNDMIINLSVSNTPRSIKISTSEAGLDSTEWQPFYTPMYLPASSGKKAFVQVLSPDYVPSKVKIVELDLSQ